MALIPARVQWSESGTLTSLDYGDIYFQRGKGLEESRYVFIEKNNLEERFKNANGAFCIGELGFGSGLNFLLTAKLFAATAPANARLVYASIEKHPIGKQDLGKIHACFEELRPFSDGLQKQYPPLIEGFHHLSFLDGRISLLLLFGDVAEMLPQLSGKFDVWYLDGFMPAKNPQMWEISLYGQIFEKTKTGGTLSTFSAVGDFRRGLKAAGFSVQRQKGFGYKYHMTVAKKPGAVEASRPLKTILVAGAGIAGCSAAYALAKRGYSVTVVDRQKTAAAETSGNPVGIVYPKLTVDSSPMGQYHSHAFCFTRNLLQNLELSSWNPCGVLHLDMDEDDKKRTAALFEKQQYPEDFAQKTADGFLQPTAGYLSPPEFCRKLLEHQNIKTVFGEDANNLTADIVIIAQGHDSKTRSETAWLPLQSLRGQITFLKANDISKNLDKVICHDGYVTPAIDGIHYIGATFQQEEPETPALREEDHDENIAKLNKTLPQLSLNKSALTGGRTGYRTTTPDKLPMAGPCPDYVSFVKKENRCFENLYLTTGFGAHGMTGAPLAGEVLACLIADEPLPIPLSLYEHLNPARFILRDIKRGKV